MNRSRVLNHSITSAACLVFATITSCSREPGLQLISGYGNGATSDDIAKYVVASSDALGESNHERLMSAVSVPNVVPSCPGAIEKVVIDYLEHGADPNATGGGGDTALHRACVNGYAGAASALIAAGAWVDARNNYGETPMMLSVIGGSPEVVQLLINSGADCSLCNLNGATALDIAQRRYHGDEGAKIVFFLLEAEH